MDYSRPELADLLAADYVSGTLQGGARRRLEALLPAHPALREAVHAWQDRLAPLSTAIDPQAPPAAVWARIEAQIQPPRPASAQGTRWWQRLALWQGVAALASLVAVTSALLLAAPAPALVPVIVVLSPTDASNGGTQLDAPARPGIVASISGDGRAIVTRPLVGVTHAADRAFELWAIPADGAPRSLGVISADTATVVRRDRLLGATSALAVSLEPPGGSPTGAPTGPVLYSGKLGT